jgi:hypothetical protein
LQSSGIVALGLSLMGADGLVRLSPTTGALTQAPAPPPPPRLVAPLPSPPPVPEPSPPADGKPAFAVVSREPYAELQFRDVALRDARPDPLKNEIELTFAGPVDPDLFGRLQEVVPEWVEFAYAGSDSAIVHGRRPSTFEAIPGDGGFSLRIAARDAAADPRAAALAAFGMTPPLPEVRPPYFIRAMHATVGDWDAIAHYQAVARDNHGTGLRGTIPVDRFGAGLTSEWRNSRAGQTVGLVTLNSQVPILAYGFGIAADAKVTRGQSDSVHLIDGTTRRVDTYVGSGSFGFYQYFAGQEARLSGLWSNVGPGARLVYANNTGTAESRLVATYHAGYDRTPEAIEDQAFYDEVQFAHARRIADGLWGQAALRLRRYGVNEYNEIAKSAGFDASIRYIQRVFGFVDAGIGYDGHGEYVFDTTPFPAPGGAFVPLGMRNREVHAASLFLSTPIFGDLSLDGYGGWAYDRYDNQGYFWGAAFRYEPEERFYLMAGASHSEVATHQGERGPVTTVGINALYKD